MNPEPGSLNEPEVIVYKGLYYCYRFLSLASVAILGGEGISDWLSGARSPLALAALVASVGYWAAALWSSPDLLSGQWERRLPDYALRRRPSVIWLPIIALAVLAGMIFHACLLLMMVLIFIPSLSQGLFVLIFGGVPLVTVPAAVGFFRLYWHMRTGRADEFRHQAG